MNFSGIGDLAQNLVMKQKSAALQRSLSQLTEELVSGKKSNIANVVQGDFGPLATYQRSLQMFDGFAQARASVDLSLGNAQTALEGLQTLVSGLGHELLATTSLGQGPGIDAHIADAAERLESAVLLTNARVGDRYLFSGEDVTTPPMADAEVILDALRTATSGAVTQADFELAIDNWFDLPGGGFETLGYQGGAARSEAIRVGPAQAVRQDLTAADVSFKDTIRNLGKLALLAEGSFAGDLDARTSIAQDASLKLIEANDRIIERRAELGVDQNLVSVAEAQIETERTALTEARSKITDADPFETASALEALQLRIETLYMITARNSRLNLMEYLR